MTKDPAARSRLIGAIIAVGFIALLGLRTAKYLKDREQVQMYQQMQADYFENGLADDIMEMQRERQMAELQPTLDLIAGVTKDAAQESPTPTEPVALAKPANLVSTDEALGPTPSEPDPSAPHKEH